MQLKHSTIICPHCGHHLHIELDYSDGDQDFYEDCSNCCNPVHLSMHINLLARKLDVTVSADDEQIY